ncbi:hypothetical protein RE428_31760 [Marinobacter nanhaiticus D15-8W]|uniref:Uncharacterized protein n=1 Tax=Marinobacter nanhaiticus D15-8W TaxID=626887 RepID=N6W9H4_9GAMM|nr:hypothetical protein [Marinobacter nanhaiticus]ENO16934.1 hypothetical protein J057_01645 [Marinobacter nanhaiticus D15-8W]BES72158.1 hypothetical protein RE428_31760 [Marinobacter nanhaiticus D15-8W]
MGILLIAALLVADWFASNLIIVKGRNIWLRCILILPAAMLVATIQSVVYLVAGSINGGQAVMMLIMGTGAHAFMIGIFMAITAIRLHLRPAADSDHLP